MPQSVKIIAEIGENHHGAWDLALKLLEEAANNGADIVKFQSYTPDMFLKDDPEYAWFEKVALPDEKHFEFQNRARQLNVEFMSSPFSCERAKFLCEKLGLSSIKIASGLICNFKMLDIINSNFGKVKTVYVSTGMADITEIRQCLKHLKNIEEVVILHCVTQYPAKNNQANLSAITTLRDKFPGYRIGYSDHTIGLTACLVAVALGATVLEKHFTFSTLMPGSDHSCAMEPVQLKLLAQTVNDIKELLGNGAKMPLSEELQIRDIVRNRFSS